MTRIFFPIAFVLFFLSLGGPAAWPADHSEVRPDIAGTQKQIDEILRLHEQIKKVSQSQALEIQRITDQASIHKKILQDLQKTGVADVRKKYLAKDAAELLRQEKIRLIQEQTLQNRNWIERVSPQPVQIEKEPDSQSE